MPSAPTDTLAPAVHTTETGAPRRVGVEIEFGDLDVDTAADLLADIFEGTISRHTDYEIGIVTPDLGEFKVEVDFRLLKRLGQERAESAIDPGRLEQMSEDMLAAFARQVVPSEIVTPPLPFSRLADLERLVARLREAGALGTEDALVYAFGVHFNPEAPSLQATSILAYLRAFVLLYDWLKAELRVDAARRIMPFIKPFPASYVRLILDAGYQPNIPTLIDDYLLHNPTRNRALDMLPLFSHIDKDRVFAMVNDPNINPRPTYHYRLSNSHVGNPSWRLTDEWRYWLMIEALANKPDTLKAMAQDYCALLDRPLGDVFSDWVKKTPQWLDAL